MSSEINSVTGSPLLSNTSATSNQTKTQSVAPEERQAKSPMQQATPVVSNPRPDRTQLDQALVDLIQHAQIRDTRVQFKIEDNYGEIVLQVLDAENREMIRQIPAEEILKIAKFFRDLEAARGGADAKNPKTGLSFWEGLLIDTRV